MKLLIFGASEAREGYGSNLVSQALRVEYIVTASVRTPSKVGFQHERLNIIHGGVSNHQQVETAVTNQEIVLSALVASSPFKRGHSA